MKRILLISFVLMSALISEAWAQRTVSGKVTSAIEGEGLPGVTVRAKGTTTGVNTDFDGNYRLNVPEGSNTLVFSFVGFTTQEVEIGSRSVINVTLEEDVRQLQEVVVQVPYGAQTKKSFTGAASTIDSESLEVRPVTSFQNAMQGLSSGVQVNTASGQPGGGTNINIRGVGSLNASSQPLYVIDGVPVASGNYSRMTGNLSGSSNVLSAMNPSDIESITVLKDASASSLYGSRAANGVILITTKKGKLGEPKITFNGSTGVNSLAVDQHEVLGADQYFKTYWDQAYQNNLEAGLSADEAAAQANTQTINNLDVNPYNTENIYGANGVKNADARLLYDSDWRDAVLGQGTTQNYSLSASGGNENTKYYLSTGYFDQKGIVPSSDFTRYSGKVSVDSKISERINVGISTNTSYSEQNTPPGGGGAANPLRFANLVSNVYSIYQRDEDGNIVNSFDGNPLYNYNNPIVLDFNALGNSELDTYRTNTLRSLNSLHLDIELLEGLKFRTQAGADLVYVKDNLYYNPMHGNGAGVNGRAQRYQSTDNIITLTNTLEYNKVFGDHSINVLVGQEMWKSHYETLELTKVDFPVPGLEELSVGATPSSATSYFTDKRIASYLSRVNYSYLDRYYLSGSFRRDGSSVFGADSRWGNFWSAGASWILSEEAFLSGVDALDLLKLRASYGINGNDNIGRYDARGLISFGYNYNGSPGSTYTQLANPNLSWEQNKNLDLGVEFGLFNRISGEVVYFQKVTDDLLFDKPLSMTTGFDDITTNLAKMQNSGVEVDLRATLLQNANWTINLGGNFAHVRNEILAMSQEFLINGSKRWEVGSDRYQFFIEEFAGVDPTDGAPMWYTDVLNAEGDPTGERETTKDYAMATRYHQGSSLPKFFGGINPRIKFKSFDLSMILSYSLGHKIYDNSYADIMHMGSKPGQQLSVDALNAWTPENPNTDVPRFEVNNSYNYDRRSTRFLFDGDYARVKNITFGYNLPNELLSRISASSARFYVTGENLFTFAKHKGLDPELPNSGMSNNLYPANKTILVGLNLSL